MKRRLFNAGALVSLMLCVQALLLWGIPNLHLFYRSESGYLVIDRRIQYVFEGHYREYTGEPETKRWSFGGIYAEAYRVQTKEGSALLWRQVRLPTLYAVSVTAAFPLTWVVARWWMRRRDWQKRSCPACGYDLRGTDSKTCPECGVATAAR